MEHCMRGPALIARRMAARRDLALQTTTPEANARIPEADDAVPGASQPDTRLTHQLSNLSETVAVGSKPQSAHAPEVVNLSDWRRECYTLPPQEAREAARAWLARYPAARWRSEIENWRIVGDDLVQFTVRRLPQAV